MLLIYLQEIPAPIVSLLMSFVGVSNTVITVFFFIETISSRIWTAIFLIIICCMSLSFTSDLKAEEIPVVFGILILHILWGFDAG